jgi:hypothetical protein
MQQQMETNTILFHGGGLFGNWVRLNHNCSSQVDIVLARILCWHGSVRFGNRPGGCVQSLPSELENTVRRLKTSGTMSNAVAADETMPIIPLEWSAIAP